MKILCPSLLLLSFFKVTILVVDALMYPLTLYQMASEERELMASQNLTLFSAKVSERKYYCCCRYWLKLPNDCWLIILPWNNTIFNVCIPKVFASTPLRELICTIIPKSRLFVTFIPDAPLTRHGEIASSFEQLYRVQPSIYAKGVGISCVKSC